MIRSLLLSCAAVILGTAAPAHCQTFGQTIENDPFIQEAIDPSQFEPGGQFFTFDDRGTITDRSGGFTITPQYTQDVGSFSLQGAALGGTYKYTNNLDEFHPIEIHGAFSNDASSSTSGRRENQSSQSSYRFQWQGREVHPSNAYDGPPSGAGARDEYSYSINGIATGVYLRAPSDIQQDDLTVEQRLENANIAQQNAGNRFANGLINATSGNLLEGSLDTALGVRDTLTAPLEIVQPEMASGWRSWEDFWVTDYPFIGFMNRSVDGQYRWLASNQKLDEIIERNPVLVKGVDLITSVGGSGALTKGIAKVKPIIPGAKQKIGEVMQDTQGSVPPAKPKQKITVDGVDGFDNPYKNPAPRDLIVVDNRGNAIPVQKGERIASSPDGDFQQVTRDINNKNVATGVRMDRGGHPRQSDPKARQPHGHRPNVTIDGNPHLPIR